MKIKSLSLTNFANYDKVEASFDPNVTYLIGKNGAGKSTLGITGVWFMLQGIAEKSSGGNTPLIGERFRFIGPRGASARGEMVLVDEKKGIEIKVIRKLTKSGTELSFEAPEGMELGQQWLTDLFNLFLIAPKRFAELSAKDQAKALGIDTKSFDDRIAALKQEYTLIGREIKAFGELVAPEKVERVDTAELLARKEQVRTELNRRYQDNRLQNEKARKAWTDLCRSVDAEVQEHNNAQADLQRDIRQAKEAFQVLTVLGYRGREVQDWMTSELIGKEQPLKVAAELYPKEPAYIPEMPDASEMQAIDAKIASASEINEKALMYEQYEKRAKAKADKEAELAKNKKSQDDIAEERLAYIKKFKLPFSNLSIGEDGELLLNGKPIQEPYFSTGELLKIIPLLFASQNPELKYVFLQDFNLLDDEKQAEIEAYLVKEGFQLVVELVGKEKVADKNCILLRDGHIVEDLEPAEGQMQLL